MTPPLEEQLRGLALAIAYPPTPGLAAAMRGRLEQPKRPRFALTRVRVAVLALVAALAVALGVPPFRTAIAHWLGIQGVVINPVGTLPPLPSATASGPSALGLGQLSDLDRARAVTGFTALVPSALGTPDSVWLRSDVGPVLSLVYAPRPGYPQVRATGVGVLVTEFRGATDDELIQKFAGPTTTVTPVTVDGRPGFWLGGTPHEVAYRLPDGSIAPDSLRLAAPTLVFERGELTIRIEGAISHEQAMAVAASLH